MALPVILPANRGGQSGAGAFQPFLADLGEPLTLLPQVKGLLQRQPAGLEALDEIH